MTRDSKSGAVAAAAKTRGKLDRRPWQRMLSGLRLNLEEPTPVDVELIDIAHGLSRVARWNGQTLGEWAFSVAQHSLLVERLCAIHTEPQVRPQLQMLALLHDAPEYVIGDLISPFKARMGDEYKSIEARIFDAILYSVRLNAAATPAAMKLIKQVDRAAAYLEAVHLAGFEVEEATRYFRPQPWAIVALETGQVDLTPMRPEDAKSAFLDRFDELAPELGLKPASRHQAALGAVRSAGEA